MITRNISLQKLCFLKVGKKNLFNFMKRNTLKIAKPIDEVNEKDNEKEKEIPLQKPEEKKDEKLNPDQVKPKKEPIKESRINKYYRDDIKKYDGRLN